MRIIIALSGDPWVALWGGTVWLERHRWGKRSPWEREETCVDRSHRAGQAFNDIGFYLDYGGRICADVRSQWTAVYSSWKRFRLCLSPSGLSHHRLGDFNSRNFFFFLHFWRPTSKIKVLSRVNILWGILPWCPDSCLLAVCSHSLSPGCMGERKWERGLWCLFLLLEEGNQSSWIRASPLPAHVTLITSMKTLFPNTVTGDSFDVRIWWRGGWGAKSSP